MLGVSCSEIAEGEEGEVGEVGEEAVGDSITMNERCPPDTTQEGLMEPLTFCTAAQEGNAVGGGGGGPTWSGVVYGSGSQTGGRVPLGVHGSTAGVLENNNFFTLSEFQL